MKTNNKRAAAAAVAVAMGAVGVVMLGGPASAATCQRQDDYGNTVYYECGPSDPGYPTATNKPSGGPTPTGTATPSPTATASPSVSPTGSASPSPSSSPTATPITISGGSSQSPVYGSTYAVTGTAPANSTVSLNFHKAGTPTGDYSIVRTVVADSNGQWTRLIVANVDYRYYATVGDQRSINVLSQPVPTIDGDTSRVVERNQAYTLTGRAVPGSTVFLHFHKPGTAAGDYSIVRSAVVNASGGWARTYVATVDYRLYVSRSASDSPSFASYLVQAR